LASRLLILVGASLVLGTIASAMFISVLHGDIHDTNSLKILQLAESISLFILPALITAYLFSTQPIGFLKVNTKIRFVDLLLAGLLMIVLIPFINLISEWNQHLSLPSFMSELEQWMKSSEASATQVTERFLNVNGIGALVFNLMLIAAIPALGEELFFRGIIQTSLAERKKAVMAVLVTAFVFSAIHLQFYGFVPRFLLGALLGFLFVWSDNIWLPVFAHFVNNGVAVIFYYLKFNHYHVTDLEKIGTGDTTWLAVLSGIVTIAVVVYLRNRIKSFS
jgi:uncharacterized protein